ncbi:MAG TPA: hypothetical protein PLD48_08025 [Bacillota bacterium]|nr:hypothetical protein [Bacillota bacterium]HOK69714.1 hypothetical protein [Bacillota bacterium]HPP85576.1 hypothetical protein [Bacillota bacterium]
MPYIMVNEKKVWWYRCIEKIRAEVIRVILFLKIAENGFLPVLLAAQGHLANQEAGHTAGPEANRSADRKAGPTADKSQENGIE